MSIIKMTSAEMKKSITTAMLERAKQAARREPNMSDQDAPDLSELLRADVKRRRGRPVKEIKKGVLSLRLATPYIAKLRRNGRGWQTRLREYVEQGIAAGAL
jgi:uncharacterized protein (DUF4415 family)